MREFLALDEAAALAAANKRVGNILKKSDAAAADAVDRGAARGAGRAARWPRRSPPSRRRADAAFGDGRVRSRRCRLLAGLKPPVDAFFDSVMVNVESPALRANRLALLAALRTTMNRVADLSRLAV